ncbi:30S ribosomal protein S12, partial [Pseudomonas syringae pv. tagetis]
LIRGGRVREFPCVRYHTVPASLATSGVKGRNLGRSK